MKSEFNRYEEIGNWDFSSIKYITEQESSWDFYKEISKYANSNSILLDLGTGGGEKVLKFMPDCKKIIATDFSPKMIETANENKKNYPNKNIAFKVMDNLNMTFEENTFDIVSARHTIIDAKQIYNSLKPGGVLIVEGVDKEDCIELKDLFGRGQAYTDKNPISKIDYDNIKNAGFKNIDLQKIVQYEYYETKDDLLALLLKTPILDDFSEEENTDIHYPIIEEDILDKYISTHLTSKGIVLKRVLYGIVAKK